MFKLILINIDRNIGVWITSTIVVACLEILLFSTVDMKSKIIACSFGIIMMLISAAFFYIVVKMTELLLSIFGPFDIGGLKINVKLILDSYSYLFLIAGLYFLIAYPLLPNLVGADGEIPINLLLIIPGIYWVSRKKSNEAGKKNRSTLG